MTQLFLMICGPDGFPMSMTKDSLQDKFEVTIRYNFNFTDPSAKGSVLLKDGNFFAWLRNNNLWFLLLGKRTEDYYQAAAVADLRRVNQRFTETYHDSYQISKREDFKKYEFAEFDAILEKELATMKTRDNVQQSLHIQKMK